MGLIPDKGVSSAHFFNTFCLNTFCRPEPKAQVHYCDYTLSVVQPSVVCPSLTFHICVFFSETAERNSTKLDMKQDLNVFYQVRIFRTDRKKNQDGRSSLWLAEIFFTLSLKTLNGFKRNLTGSNILTSSTKFVFFGPIGKTRFPPRPLIGWNLLDFSSETTERNSTKLDRKKRSQCPLTSFSGRLGNENCRPSRSVKKVAHCTQVYDMSPFGPLDYLYQRM